MDIGRERSVEIRYGATLSPPRPANNPALCPEEIHWAPPGGLYQTSQTTRNGALKQLCTLPSVSRILVLACDRMRLIRFLSVSDKPTSQLMRHMAEADSVCSFPKSSPREWLGKLVSCRYLRRGVCSCSTSRLDGPRKRRRAPTFLFDRSPTALHL